MQEYSVLKEGDWHRLQRIDGPAGLRSVAKPDAEDRHWRFPLVRVLTGPGTEMGGGWCDSQRLGRGKESSV